MNGSESLKGMAIALKAVIDFLYSFTDFLLMLFGYSLLLVLPMLVGIATYRQMKADSQQKAITNEDTLIHFKASIYTFFAMLLSTLIFIFIFKTLIGLSGDTKTVITTILHINKAFK